MVIKWKIINFLLFSTVICNGYFQSFLVPTFTNIFSKLALDKKTGRAMPANLFFFLIFIHNYFSYLFIIYLFIFIFKKYEQCFLLNNTNCSFSWKNENLISSERIFSIICVQEGRSKISLQKQTIITALPRFRTLKTQTMKFSLCMLALLALSVPSFASLRSEDQRVQENTLKSQLMRKLTLKERLQADEGWGWASSPSCASFKTCHSGDATVERRLETTSCACRFRFWNCGSGTSKPVTRCRKSNGDEYNVVNDSCEKNKIC